MENTLYMVVEHFKNNDAVAVYRRFRDSGRMAPKGLMYMSSWVDDKFERCYQLMETHDRRLSGVGSAQPKIVSRVLVVIKDRYGALLQDLRA
jgi:hypothetical protein